MVGGTIGDNSQSEWEEDLPLPVGLQEGPLFSERGRKRPFLQVSLGELVVGNA